MNELPKLRFYCADQNPQRDRSLGITNYTRGLIEHLKQRGEFSLSAVVSRSSFRTPEGIRTMTLPFRTDAPIGRLVSDHGHPLMGVNSGGIALWHYPKGFLPIGPQVRSPKIGTVADTILQFYADRYPASRGRVSFIYWIALLKHSIRKFDAIITISEYSRRSIHQFCGRYNIQAPPIHVVYIGVDVPRVEPQVPNETIDYVVHLASKQPHKRTSWLVSQWLQLEGTAHDLPKLVLFGQVEPKVRHQIARSRSISIEASLPTDELFQRIAQARALILPSEIEGFGLPAIEAYLVNTPVVYVKNTTVEEILGPETPGGFDFDQDSFRGALVKVLSLSPEKIAAKARHLRTKFSWESCTDQTSRIYKSLI